MNNFGATLTPEEAAVSAAEEGRVHAVDYWRAVAARPARLCLSCQQLPEWKYGETGLCFSCTTGEADASEDYELEDLTHAKLP